MIINKIELHNFKSHKKTIINLGKGITSITGLNGAGKSSILEAISYALFKKFTGKIDDLVRKPINDDDIIKEMKVKILFTSNGRTYELVRGKKNTNTIASLRVKKNKEDPGILQSNKDKLVTENIEEILEMDSDSFLNAVYIKQGEITDLIEKTASERKEFISKLLNLDSLELSWEEIKNIITYYEDQKNINQGKIENTDKALQEFENTEKTKKETEVTIQEIQAKYDIKQKEQKTLKKQKETLEKTKLNYNKLKEDLVSHNKTKNFLKEEKEEIEKELEQIEEIEFKIKKIEKELSPLNTLKEIKNKKEEYDGIKRDHVELLNKIKINNQRKIKLNETKDDYKLFNIKNKEKEEIINTLEELQEKEKEYIKIKTELQNQINEKEELIKDIRKIVTQAGKILNKTFKNPDEVNNIINQEKEKKNNSLNILQKQLQKNKQEISVILSKNENIKKSERELKKIHGKCPVCQSSINSLKQEDLLHQYKTELNQNILQLDSLNNANINQEQKIVEINDFLKKIDQIDVSILVNKYERFNSLLKKISEKETELKEFKNYEQIIEEIKNKLNNVNTKLNELEKNRQEHITLINILNEEENIEEIKNKEELLRNNKEKIELKIKTLSKKVVLKDNLVLKIKYLEEKQKQYNQLQGIISNKENISLKLKKKINQIEVESKSILNKEAELNNLDYQDDKYQIIINTYTSNDNILIKYNKILNQNKGKEIEINKQLNYLKERINENKKLKEEQETLLDYIKLLKQIREIYSKDGVQKDLRNLVKPQIEKNTREIFDNFGFDSYSNIQLDENYDILIQGSKDTITLNMLSGGEKIAMALALRLGITEVISNKGLELLILDEPTIHLDESRRKYLVKIIQKINMVPQMIVVSHDEELNEISDKIIKISKIGGISKIEE